MPAPRRCRPCAFVFPLLQTIKLRPRPPPGSRRSHWHSYSACRHWSSKLSSSSAAARAQLQARRHHPSRRRRSPRTASCPVGMGAFRLLFPVVPGRALPPPPVQAMETASTWSTPASWTRLTCKAARLRLRQQVVHLVHIPTATCAVVSCGAPAARTRDSAPQLSTFLPPTFQSGTASALPRLQRRRRRRRRFLLMCPSFPASMIAASTRTPAVDRI